MPLGLQSKLTGASAKEFSFGLLRVRKVDVRLLRHQLRSDKLVGGKFREDLFYRLQVMNIAMPPLRERKEETLPCSHFIKRFNREQTNRSSAFPCREAFNGLRLSWQHPATGQHLSMPPSCPQEEIVAENLPIEVRGGSMERKSEGNCRNFWPTFLKEIERIAIQATLEKNKGHREKTASILGISRRSLLNKINEYKLEEKI